MKHPRIILLLVTFFVPMLASAETMYVTDQLTVPLRADVTPGSAVIKTMMTGTALEVIERGTGLLRVRDAQGTEGWVEANLLSPQMPAALQVKALRAELDRTRSQLVQVQTQLDKAKAAPSGSVMPVGAEQLQTEAATLRAQLVQAQADLKKKDEQLQGAIASPPSADAILGAPASSPWSTFLWLGLAFAMLVIGFAGGIIWIKESIRRRMGGLYLRI